MGTTPNLGFPYPEPTDPVASGAQDFEDLADAIDTALTNGSPLYVDDTNNRLGINDATPSYDLDVTGDINATSDIKLAGDSMPRGIVASVRSTGATATVASGAITAFITSTAFTPVAGRKYRVTYNVGYAYKTTAAGNIYIDLRLGTGTGGTVLDGILHSTATLNQYFNFEKTTILTSTELGTSSTQLTVTVDTNSNSAQFTSDSVRTSNIIVEDIGT